jgi:hypothetical protein
MTLLDLRPNYAGEIVHAIAHACRPLPDPAYMMPDTYPFGL